MNHPPFEIINGLYLGSEFNSATRLTLIERNIRYIVNAAATQCANHFVDFGKFDYLPLPVYDTTADDIGQYFDATYDFIDSGLSTGRGVLVHCKSGNSRAASIIMAYLIRKFDVSLVEAIRFTLLRTNTSAKPNPAFLIQLVHYEKKIIGSTSFIVLEEDEMEDSSLSSNSNSRWNNKIISLEQAGLFVPKDEYPALIDENGSILKEVEMKLKMALTARKWEVIREMNEKYKDQNSRVWPNWRILLRRSIFQVVSKHINFVVEKIPSPDHPKAVQLDTYFKEMKGGLEINLGTNPEDGYLFAYDHAITYSMSVTNAGIGDLLVDHLNQVMVNLYKNIHFGKFKAGTELQSEAIDAALESAKTTFKSFEYLVADPLMNSYFETYEAGLAQRLAHFLPLEFSPTSPLLSLEVQIIDLMPHHGYSMRARKMIDDITKTTELTANWKSAYGNFIKNQSLDLKVSFLDSQIWPTKPLVKSLVESKHLEIGEFNVDHMDLQTSKKFSIFSIPNSILPLDIFEAWNSSIEYFGKEQGKTAVLLPQFGDAVVNASLNGKTYTIEMSTSMMIVLCLFNDVESFMDQSTIDGLTFEQISNRTNLPNLMLKTTLASLSQPSYPLLIANHGTNHTDINDSNKRNSVIYSLNNNFVSKSRKFKIPLVKSSSKSS